MRKKRHGMHESVI